MHTGVTTGVKTVHIGPVLHEILDCILRFRLLAQKMDCGLQANTRLGLLDLQPKTMSMSSFNSIITVCTAHCLLSTGLHLHLLPPHTHCNGPLLK